MTELVDLRSGKLSDIKIHPDSAIDFAQNSHMIVVRVTELAQAIIDFPIVISRTGQGEACLSILTSFEPGRNLYVTSRVWDSGFTPSLMQTHPVFLMKDPNGKSDPILGVNPDSQALSREVGDALFDKKGKPSLKQKEIKAKLLQQSKATSQSFHFLETLKAHDLIRPVDILLNYEDGEMSRIQGLSMIHEDNLQALEPAKLIELREKGYLAPIYAMLLSVFQLNALIRRNNLSHTARKIKTIKLEVSEYGRQA